MAKTYEPIATNTVTGSTTTAVTFSSLGAYTDIQIVMNATSVGASDYAAVLTFNGDTGSNYSTTQMRGTGSAAQSNRATSASSIVLTTNYSIMQTPSTILIMLQNYANTTTYKTTLSRFSQVNPAGGTAAAIVGLWRNTAAITSLTITISGDFFASGSTFTLYGIKAA